MGTLLVYISEDVKKKKKEKKRNSFCCSLLENLHQKRVQTVVNQKQILQGLMLVTGDNSSRCPGADIGP